MSTIAIKNPYEKVGMYDKKHHIVINKSKSIICQIVTP